MLVATRVVVDDTAVLIAGSKDPSSIGLKNTGTVDVELGGADVAFGEGFPLASGEMVSLDLERGEVVWAVTDADEGEIAFIRAGTEE